jgi:hypothetical protein
MLDGIFTNPSTKPDRTPLEFPSYLHEKRRPNQTMRDPQSVLKLVESADLPAPISPEQLLGMSSFAALRLTLKRYGKEAYRGTSSLN